MQNKPNALLPLINAARYLAVEHVKQAARGERGKFRTFLGVMALEAAHALIALEGEEAELDVAVHERSERMIEIQLTTPIPEMTQWPVHSVHGPN